MSDAAIRIESDGAVSLNMDTIKKIAAKDGPNASHATFAHAILAARSAALEEAAKVAERMAREEPFSDDVYGYGPSMADAIASAIFALK